MYLDNIEPNIVRQNSEKMWNSLIALTHDMIVAHIEENLDEPYIENEPEQQSFF